MGGKAGTKFDATDGARAYKRWIVLAEAQEGEVALPNIGSRVLCWLLGSRGLSVAKEEIVSAPHFEDFADAIEDGASPSVLDLTRSYGKSFDFGEGGAGFESIFPACIPIAVGSDDEEECFFFVDTRRPGYPVLYWTHDMFGVAASDLASFLAEMKA